MSNDIQTCCTCTNTSQRHVKVQRFNSVVKFCYSNKTPLHILSQQHEIIFKQASDLQRTLMEKNM